MTSEKNIFFCPIGYVRTKAEKLPRHWSVSQETGVLEIHPEFEKGLQDIETGQKIVVLFHFHKSPAFDSANLVQSPAHHPAPKGVFSICSPKRPNAIGMSVVTVTGMDGTCIKVKHIDMMDGTPILDIKPLVTGNEENRS